MRRIANWIAAHNPAESSGRVGARAWSAHPLMLEQGRPNVGASSEAGRPCSVTPAGVDQLPPTLASIVAGGRSLGGSFAAALLVQLDEFSRDIVWQESQQCLAG